MTEQNETNNKIQLKNLHNFLDKYRINKAHNNGLKSTHVSMGDFIGSFHIPDDKQNELFKLYKRATKVGNIPNLLESHLEQGPVIIDLDFKYTINNDKKNKRIYSLDDIKIIIELYNKVICSYFAINEADFSIYLMEKKSPKIVSVDDINHKKTYKDGVHIIYPEICICNRVQLFIRELIIGKIKKDNILSHLDLENSIDDVFDKAVIERNNWLLYGSGKDSNIENLYQLSKIYNYKLEEIDGEELDLVSFLSIRKFKSESDHAEYVENMSFEKVNSLYENILGKGKPYVNNSEMIKARKLLGMLSLDRGCDYSNWIELGFCLHNIDDSLLEDWIDFSKRVPDKFKDGYCEKMWKNFKYEGLNIGSLFRWAKEDNPSAYSEYIINEVKDSIKMAVQTSFSVAKVFYELNKYQYKCASINKKLIYEFRNHRWVRVDEANSIINILNTDITNEFIKLSRSYSDNALASNDHEEKKKWTEKADSANKIALKIQDMKFKKTVVEELCHLYYDAKFFENLDENRYLIGFSNGVYDLNNNYFRNGRPEDYISMSTNCDYIEYNKSDKNIIAVEHFFDQIQQESEMKDYLLTKLSSFLEGIQRDQKFEIWIGTGANGKGRIIKLILDSFGDYATTIPITLLTKPRGGVDNASPALANTKGKRCCLFQEPEPDDKIHVGHMKNLTGGDKLMARSLYCDPVEFYPQFKTILACNKLPEVPSADGGTWRRIRVVPFNTKFVENPTESNHKKIIKNLDDLMIEWKSAFMSILIEKYKLYIRDGIDEPPKVLIYTNQYQNNSDIYMEFIKDKLISSDDEYIHYDELFGDFKKWYMNNHSDKKKIKSSDFKAEMEIKLGKPKGNKYSGWRFKNQSDDDNEYNEYQTQTDKLNSSFNINTSLCNKNSNINSDVESLKIKKSNITKKLNNIDIDEDLDDIFINNKVKVCTN